MNSSILHFSSYRSQIGSMYILGIDARHLKWVCVIMTVRTGDCPHFFCWLYDKGIRFITVKP